MRLLFRNLDALLIHHSYVSQQSLPKWALQMTKIHCCRESGLWFELCFKEIRGPFRVPRPNAIQELGEEVLDIHFALRAALWKRSKNPLAILLGIEFTEWYDNNIVPIAVSHPVLRRHHLWQEGQPAR